MITLVVMTDGRKDCLLQAAKSFHLLDGPISVKMIHDDSGDPTYRKWLLKAFPDFYVHSTGERSGFDGAMRSVRYWIGEHDRNDYIFHTEDDFVFTRTVPLRDMATILDWNPHLTQLALRRQPWNEQERAAGGIVEQFPDDYVDKESGAAQWLEHTKFFTTNPSLIPRHMVTDHEWPTGEHSEGRFGYHLFQDYPEKRSAFWGSRESGEWCEHVGHVRVGTGY